LKKLKSRMAGGVDLRGSSSARGKRREMGLCVGGSRGTGQSGSAGSLGIIVGQLGEISREAEEKNMAGGQYTRNGNLTSKQSHGQATARPDRGSID